MVVYSFQKLSVERLSPSQNRCELFAREVWARNELWVNETMKFEGATNVCD
jgi:hypothetical protein